MSLKSIRKQRKLTQTDIAHLTGVTLRTYQRWENGESSLDNVPYATVSKLASALKLTTDDVIAASKENH